MNGFGFDGNKWGWLLFFIIVIVLNIIITSIAVNLNLYYNQNFWFIFIMQTTIAFLTIQPDTFYSKEHMASIFFLVSIIILVMSFLLGKIESHRVSEKITNYRVEFLYHDSIISTDTDSLFFVGETTEFIFLYNINSEKAELFKKDDISNLRFFPSIWDLEEFSETSKSSRPNDQGIIHQ
ncbi:hypothetical protein [Algoriphagus zhangzhouensis]|uniref:Uncharacterized protein n=1 Tax=Algoriphagus zhangzhouensis TaxID=1073327 RepID=A0A1M7ZJ33_9BACT|nr:hypothetical protein [Algoriphagus zhangzhouensis]TDY43630.1 hypothetical protein A8938_3729 [Algoriphagus zhangzhouensis]SHO64903.1 hypothetical protein SAMN04488108_3731 [Algoriphagus zhangzhouensis]